MGTRNLFHWSELKNSGSVHYDFDNLRQVWSHGKGQDDNWCQCSGFDTDEPCDILATKELDEPEGASYLVYKTLNKCCKLGKYEKGFGPLRPDWLTKVNPTFVQEKTVGSRNCYEWASGAAGDWFMMKSGNWAVDKDGISCTYQDVFK